MSDRVLEGLQRGQGGLPVISSVQCRVVVGRVGIPLPEMAGDHGMDFPRGARNCTSHILDHFQVQGQHVFAAT